MALGGSLNKGIGIGIGPGGGGASGPQFNGMIIDINTSILQSGGSGTNQIRLPFQPNTFNYNGSPTGLNLDIIVDWGDGTSDTYNTNPTVDYEVSHTYASPGVYTIKIDSPSQSIQGWSLHGGTSQVNNYDGRKLIDLKQWGYFDFAGNMLSPSGAQVSYQVGYNFAQADNMIVSATDIPIISGNTLRDVFSSYQGPSGSTFEIANLNNWDVSNVEEFRGIFNVSAGGGYTSPIGDVSSWDMSNAVNISAMFNNSDFVGDVSNWNTSNVTNMAACFSNTPGNPDLSNWDISNVTGNGLDALFDGCQNFIGGTWLNNWVFNAGLNTLQRLFTNTQMNTPLDNWGSYTGNINSFYALFQNNTQFNQDISGWDISGTYNTGSGPYGVLDMFSGTSSFDQDLSAWDMQATSCIARFMGNGLSFDPEISPAKYDNMLVAFGARIPYTNAKNSSWCGSQVWSFGISKYNLSNSAAVAGRNALISDMGGIVDGGGI
jgi:surface protein|tara:strand:- start:674 stop:2140 length:1467 start_codon:yes stop_codon:yes gene_type:complete